MAICPHRMATPPPFHCKNAPRNANANHPHQHHFGEDLLKLQAHWSQAWGLAGRPRAARRPPPRQGDERRSWPRPEVRPGCSGAKWVGCVLLREPFLRHSKFLIHNPFGKIQGTPYVLQGAFEQPKQIKQGNLETSTFAKLLQKGQIWGEAKT